MGRPAHLSRATAKGWWGNALVFPDRLSDANRSTVRPHEPVSHTEQRRFRDTLYLHRALWMIATLALFPHTACSHRDPQTAYEHAKQTYRNGDPLGAEKEANEGYNEFHNASSDWAWKFLILKANALHAQSKNEEALKILSSGGAPPSSGELAIRLLRAESVANSSAGRTALADSQLKEAERLCALTEYAACADVFSVHGYSEMKRSNYKSAQQFFERASASARKSGDQFLQVDSLLNLSWAANEQTNFDQALDWAASAREIAERQHFADAWQTAVGNMGWAYYKLGDRDKAREMFLEAENEAVRLKDTSDQASWLIDAGYTYIDDGSLPLAQSSFARSLDLARKIESRDDIRTSLQALAFISELTDKTDDAKRYADEALSMARADGNKRDETYPRLVQARIAAKEHDRTAAEAGFHEVESSPDSPVFLKWDAERSLAHLYEDADQIDDAARGYRTALSTFESARSQLQHETSKLPFLNNASGIYDDYIHFLVTHGKTAESLQVAEYQRGRTLAEGLGILPKGSTFKPDLINPQATAQHAGGVILFYWLGEKQSYLWAITPHKTSLFPLPPKSGIDPIVQRYRKALADQQEFLPQVGADGRALYQTLVAPAQALLQKDSKVFIVPDGSLNTLNFETLLVSDDADKTSHYWIEDVTIADASSLRMVGASNFPTLRQAQGRRSREKNAREMGYPASARHSANLGSGGLLLLGDAVATSADYPELRKAVDEMKRIEKHFSADQQTVFARAGATPTAYLASKPGQFSYVHFVAHGTASRTSPLDSAIVLSSSGTQGDSFKLYARDIVHEPLHAQLVTVSTCYGAGARAYSGEGLVGLSWAFLRAGAHNVIGALWEVSDISTPQLMDALYGSLKNGERPDAALRAAKLSLLHSNTAFKKPFYWAPFQLYTGS